MRIWPFRRAVASAEPIEAQDRGRRQKVLVICHAADAEGLAVMNNLCAAFEFARLDWSVFDLDKAAAWPDLQVFSCVVTCTEQIEELDESAAGRLGTYVRGGGGLMVAYRCRSAALAALFGFPALGALPAFGTSTGLVFEEDIVPGVKGLAVQEKDWSFEHDRIDLARRDLSSDATVLISDDDGQPIAWRRREAAGRVVFWNTSVLFSRSLRGFAVQTTLDALGAGVSAMAGFGMLHVDDFPPSISAARPEPLAIEFPERDWTSFAFDIWLGDIRKLAARHRIPLTWYVVINYFDVDNGAVADLSTPSVADGRRVLGERFEKFVPREGEDYGFHGYNHDPLIDANWPDVAALRSKLGCARALWETTVPAPLPTSWVPANNWYHRPHVEVLREVFPEITTLCGLLSTGDGDLGGLRDFGPEPWVPSLFCVPRETSGYVANPEQRMLMLSQIGGLGVWTHFIHPDDIVDIPREAGSEAYCRNPDVLLWRSANAAGQPGLLSQLDAWLGVARERFPWLTFLTTSGAAEAWRQHMAGTHAVDVFADRLEVSSSRGRIICVSLSDSCRVGKLESAVQVGAFDTGFRSLSFLKLESARAIIHVERADSTAGEDCDTGGGPP